MNEDSGRVASPPGSREPSPDGLGPSGFDPSRWIAKRATAGTRTYAPVMLSALVRHPTSGSWRACVHLGNNLWRRMKADGLVDGTCCASHLTLGGYTARNMLCGGGKHPDMAQRAAEARRADRAQDALRDSDGSPKGRDREAGLDGEAATARAEGIAQPIPSEGPSNDR